MTNAPAGWYPGPDGRPWWWDGRAWTPGSDVDASVVQSPADRPRVPDGTAVHTPWMWGIVAIAAAGLVQTVVLLFAVSRYFQELFAAVIGQLSRTDQGPDAVFRLSADMVGFFANPWFILTASLGWVLLAASVVFAYFDRAALLRRGFVRPFPWPWALLGIVYAIGRSVVVWRQSGRGLSVVWVYGAIYLATILVSIGWSFWFSVWMTNEMTRQLTTLMP